jgi:rfaE bifunctional protein nucleotidyltransferase chain/domain
MHSATAPEQKILTTEALLAFCEQARKDVKTIAFTNGCFDILHRGHLDYLLKASSLADYLIIGLNSDASVSQLKGPERPLNKVSDRAYALACLSFTDYIVAFEEDTPLRLIELILPDVLIKGGDYSLETIVGAKETLAHGGKVEIISLSEGYSTTGIIKKIKR